MAYHPYHFVGEVLLHPVYTYDLSMWTKWRMSERDVTILWTELELIRMWTGLEPTSVFMGKPQTSVLQLASAMSTLYKHGISILESWSSCGYYIAGAQNTCVSLLNGQIGSNNYYKQVARTRASTLAQAESIPPYSLFLILLYATTISPLYLKDFPFYRSHQVTDILYAAKASLPVKW